MGDTTAQSGAESNLPFYANQLFDPKSVYGRMRNGLKPEAKLRGFFHYLAVQQKAKRNEARPIAVAVKPKASTTLVVAADAPGLTLDAETWLELRPFGKQRRLTLSFRVNGEPIPPGTRCRAMLLTTGMLERLCGVEATRSADAARRAVTRVLTGQDNGDAFESARVLAAVPELDGELAEGGVCKFKAFDLPEQAGHVDELPERMTVVIVIDRRQG